MDRGINRSYVVAKLSLRHIILDSTPKLQSAVSVLLFLLISQLVESFTNADQDFEGLNRWSFLSHGDIFSDQFCPNPMTGRNENRIMSADRPVPTDIWALKTSDPISFLPCELKPNANLPQNQQFGGNNRGANASNEVENKILFMNVTYFPFDFQANKATRCSKFIKLQFDEEEGVQIDCNDNPEDIDASDIVHHIYWPKDSRRRRKSFSVFRNLEKFLRNEESFRKLFYFQIYFTSKTGRRKKCIVQQYKLNVTHQGCSSMRPPRIEEVCGEFRCDELIFPLHDQDKDNDRVKVTWRSGEMTVEGKPTLLYHPEYSNLKNMTMSSFFRNLDFRLLAFVTVVPIVVVGMLIFALELIVYITCLRRSKQPHEAGDARSQQILQNSLNLWESIPNRENPNRSVSFSPHTTNIATDESQLPDPLSTPRVLKSALKKSTDNFPPPPPSFFDDREYPPAYIEAVRH